MILDTLLALGLVLSVLAQLRQAFPLVGPGEYCLAIWLVLALGREAARRGPLLLTPALSRLLIFWLLFFIAQSLGTITGVAIGYEHDPDAFMHDILAYLLAAGVSCMSVAQSEAGPRLRRVAWIVSVVGASTLALQLANVHGLFQIPGINPWFYDRFKGWTADPNQLALLSAVLGLLALFLADTAAGVGEWISAVGCAVLASYAGLLTKSNSFALVLVAAGPIFVVLKLRTWMVSFEKGVTLKFASAWIIVLAAPLVLISISAVSLDSELTVKAADFGRDKEEHTEEEAALRIYLWHSAIGRGFESGMLGLGPGPHSERPHITRSAQFFERKEFRPKSNPFLIEAHNTLLELFTQGGLIAVLSSIWLMAMAVLAAYKARQAALVTLLCGLGMFSIFHTIIRHPICWFAVALCLVAENSVGCASAVREKS